MGYSLLERHSRKSNDAQMKKTEWYYEPTSKEWWMITVVTNSKKIPTLQMPKEAQKKKAIVNRIDLAADNKKLLYVILGLMGLLGVVVGLLFFLVAS